jgi:Flp pilus assembly protein TadG
MPRLSPFCSRRGESGQVLLIAALLIPIILGMTAMAVDLGSFAAERRSLQNAADAIALAAAQELPDKSAAADVAVKWAARHDVDAADMTVTVDTGGLNPSVRIEIERPHDFAFMPVLGIDNAAVGAAATAIKTTPGAAANLVPWAVLQSTEESAAPGGLVTLKYDSNNVTTGNFGAIRLDGSGSSVYGKTIEQGSTSTVCVVGVTGCTDTSPVCEAGVCTSETGNMVGQTRSAVQYRLDNTSPSCDSFAEVFSGPTDGAYSLKSQCNPFLEGSLPSLRVILLPVITDLCNGACDYKVVKFAMFWLEGFGGNGKCTGSNCEVQGRFVSANANIGALAGTYDEDSALKFVRLVE